MRAASKVADLVALVGSGMDDPAQDDALTVSLRTLNQLAKHLKAQRTATGALTLASPEVRFTLCRHIAVTLPSHCRHIAVTLPLHCRVSTRVPQCAVRRGIRASGQGCWEAMDLAMDPPAVARVRAAAPRRTAALLACADSRGVYTDGNDDGERTRS